MRIALLVLATLICLARPAGAGEQQFVPALTRLSEILGSLHFLTNLCGESGTGWRDQMDALLAAEKPAPELRGKLVASFNRGYRSFAANYTKCSDSAHLAINRYMKEGEQLSRETADRIGN